MAGYRTGAIVLDDMREDQPSRKAFDEAVRRRLVVDPECTENVEIVVPYAHRFDATNARRLNMSWCVARAPGGAPGAPEAQSRSRPYYPTAPLRLDRNQKTSRAQPYYIKSSARGS